MEKMKAPKAPSLLLMVAMAMAAVVQPAMAADYTVGDSDGWGTNVNYNDWTAGKMFAVGNTITFKYPVYHDVLEVSPESYASCSAANPLASHSGGATTVKLTAPGTRYFICGIPRHCTPGQMHLKIDVVSSAASASPPPSPPPKSPPPPPPAAPVHSPQPMYHAAPPAISYTAPAQALSPKKVKAPGPHLHAKAPSPYMLNTVDVSPAPAPGASAAAAAARRAWPVLAVVGVVVAVLVALAH